MKGIDAAMLAFQHKWFVELVAEMREMQRAPSVLVRDGKRKAAERAVDGYIEARKGGGGAKRDRRDPRRLRGDAGGCSKGE